MEHGSRTCAIAWIDASVERLCRSLEAQVVCAREGNLARVAALADQMNETVAEIAPVVRGDPSVIGHHRVRLERLYRELELALKAEKELAAPRYMGASAMT